MKDTKLMTGETSRSWTSLPVEILTLIAVRLPLLELLSFRGTCKDFRSASSTATAKKLSSPQPWLLIHRTDTSKCTVYNEGESKTYHKNIPDLVGATCLASYQGWLLLFKDELMFFFSPFSLAKIQLPEFPHKDISGHVAAFSDQPTSPQCIVSVINPTEGAILEINVLSKGENRWTQHKIPQCRTIVDLKPVSSGATFDHETMTFYYMYGKKAVMTFCVKDEKWKPFTIVDGEMFKDADPLPYFYIENMFDRICKKSEKKIVELLDLEDDECVDHVCGLTYEPKTTDRKVYLNEVIDVTDNNKTTRRMCKGVWVQPRFYEAHKDLQW